jgi:hypothetical protein
VDDFEVTAEARESRQVQRSHSRPGTDDPDTIGHP